MRRIVTLSLAALSVLLLAGAVFSPIHTDIQFWGYSGIERSRLWVQEDGSWCGRTSRAGERTAIDLRPSATPPTNFATTEIVLYMDDAGEDWSRWNLSSIVDGGRHYRMGIEGLHRPLLFAFETLNIGQPAQVPLQLVPAGTSPIEVSGQTRAIVDCNPLPNRGTGLWLVFTDETGDWTFQRVEVGAPDSGGAGFRALRIAN